MNTSDSDACQGLGNQPVAAEMPFLSDSAADSQRFLSVCNTDSSQGGAFLRSKVR